MPPASLCVSYGVELEIPGEQSFTTVFTKLTTEYRRILPEYYDCVVRVVEGEAGDPPALLHVGLKHAQHPQG